MKILCFSISSVFVLVFKWKYCVTGKLYRAGNECFWIGNLFSAFGIESSFPIAYWWLKVLRFLLCYRYRSSFISTSYLTLTFQMLKFKFCLGILLKLFHLDFIDFRLQEYTDSIFMYLYQTKLSRILVYMIKTKLLNTLKKLAFI